ncbi:hypothetical protein ACFQ07_07485, partial [Actinomadura adrarensis]
AVVAVVVAVGSPDAVTALAAPSPAAHLLPTCCPGQGLASSPFLRTIDRRHELRGAWYVAQREL